MTEQEWAGFASTLELIFKGELDPLAEEAYRRYLGDMDCASAEAAVALLVEDGQVFLPRPGELRAAARRVTSATAPPFSEAWPVIGKALDRHWSHSASPEERQRRVQAIVTEVGAQLGEGPARWVQRTVERLVMEPTSDPDVGGVVLHRLSGEYAESCRQADEDGRVGYAIERAQASALAVGRPSLRRLDPARLLPSLPAGDVAPA